MHNAFIMHALVNMATLTIRDVPETTARKLKARAARNHRSLQREMLLVLEQSISSNAVFEPQAQYRVAKPAPVPTLGPSPGPGPVPTSLAPAKEFLTIDQLWERGRGLELSTPNESVAIIRKLRDERFGR